MISGDSRVLIQGKGYVQAKELEDGSYPVWNGHQTVMAFVTKQSPQPLFNIGLNNGKSIKITENQNFPVTRKRVTNYSSKSCDALEYGDMLLLGSKTYDFDYVSFDGHLSKLNSEQVGLLSGLFNCLWTGSVLDFPKSKKHVRTALENIFKVLNIEWEKDIYFSRTERVTYSISEDLTEELKKFYVRDQIPTVVWQSKLFAKGFLKAYFTFGIVGTNNITIKGIRGGLFLRQIQEILSLFEINSSYIKGLRTSQLIINGKNFHRLANEIGVLDYQSIFKGVDFKEFLVYKDNTLKNMNHVSFLCSLPLDEEVVYDISSEQFMANGIILNNI